MPVYLAMKRNYWPGKYKKPTLVLRGQRTPIDTECAVLQQVLMLAEQRFKILLTVSIQKEHLLGWVMRYMRFRISRQVAMDTVIMGVLLSSSLAANSYRILQQI